MLESDQDQQELLSLVVRKAEPALSIPKTAVLEDRQSLVEEISLIDIQMGNLRVIRQVMMNELFREVSISDLS